MRRPRSVLALAVTALVLGSASPVAAAPIADFEMPFRCGEVWTGTTRGSHSPSVYSVDWNRTDDLGYPVLASAPGRVVSAQTVDNGSYGIWVQIDHGNNERTLYAHMKVAYVSVGQRVDQGHLIGLLGTSGNSTGPHLHYEQRRNGTVTAPYFHQQRYTFGRSQASQNCVDSPLAGDWNGDGRGQVTIYRRRQGGTWWIKRDDGSSTSATWGLGTDQPLAGDWDGNGTTNLGVYRATSHTFFMHSPAGVQRVGFGSSSDYAVAGNWSGDARFEIGVWVPGRAEFRLRSRDGVVTTVRLGNSDDLPVTGDWDGDGITDLAVYDQSTATWTLRKVDGSGLEWTTSTRFGSPGDLPVAADWDADGLTDLGTWTPTTGTFNQRRGSQVTRLRWGHGR